MGKKNEKRKKEKGLKKLFIYVFGSKNEKKRKEKSKLIALHKSHHLVVANELPCIFPFSTSSHPIQPNLL